MNKETATYINDLLSERSYLLSERQKHPTFFSDLDVVNETQTELSLIYKAQKTIDLSRQIFIKRDNVFRNC